MPTVPPKSISLSLEFEGQGVVIAVDDHFNPGSPPEHGPTPDPDLDDVMLVPVDTGDAVHSSSSMAGPPESSVKPRISLEGLNLHSPSSILGTPFDVSSPRFEYPFPPGGVESDQVPSITSPVSSMSSGSSMSPIQMMTGFFPSTAPSMSMPIPVPQRHSHRNENSRAFFPTHNKHITKDPPMPPGLAKRRLAAGNSAAAQSPRIDSPRSISEERKASSATSNVTETQSRRTSLDINIARPPSVPVLASSPIPRKTSSS